MKPAILAVLLSLLAAGCASDAKPRLSTVSDFEVERYLGEWHQIAAIPAWFQSDCAANTTATYALAEDGLLEVVNACETADGTREEADARARFAGSESEGRLEVTFFELFGVWIWPVAGDYWIVALDPDYRWSLVGHPSRDYAWILARSRTLDPDTLRHIREILEREAYDSCALLLTTPDRQGRLCDITG